MVIHVPCKGMVQLASIGIDIGGTKTLFGLFDHEFKLVEEIKVKTGDFHNAKEFKQVLTESLTELSKKAAKPGLILGGVGIGAAALLNEDGSIKTAANIPVLDGFPLRSVVSKITGLNVIVVNDVDAGLYGEYRFGAAVGFKHIIGVFIGTGIGGALIIDGKLYRGANGIAGDIGHYLLQPFGPLSGSDRHGVLDDVASRTAIAAEAAALALKHNAPHLLKIAGTDVKRIGSNALAESIAKGDKEIENLVRHRSQMLGIVLSNMVDFLNPEMLVLGGGFTDAMPALVRDEVEAGLRAHATKEASSDLRVVVAKLKSHAGTTGAAKLALDMAA
jgi:glucokinase